VIETSRQAEASGLAISFEPLRSVLLDGGPPFLSPGWKRWVVDRHRGRRVNEAAPAITVLMGAPIALVDRLIAAWAYERTPPSEEGGRVKGSDSR
jgi:hypothetical protein